MSRRVLYVITDSGVGGSERVLLNIIKLSNPEKSEPVGVIVLKGKRETAALWEEAGIPVISLGMNKWPTPLLLLRLGMEIRRFSPDIVHSFLFHSVQASRLVKRFFGNFALISSPRVNYRFAGPFAHLVDQILKGWDNFAISESQATRRFLVEKLGYDPGKVGFVPNGVDIEKFKPQAGDRNKLRERWGVSADDVVIGAVGRFHEQKGFDVLIESLALIKKSPVRHKLVIVGEGPKEYALRELADKYSLDVVLAGLQRDMVDVYSAFDIYVQSSRYEGMSNALLEAMAMGLPCVATAVDGTMDVAKDGENIALVKPDDTVSLSVGIGVLLEKKELRDRLGRGARATAEEMTIQAMVDSTQAVHQQVVRRK